MINRESELSLQDTPGLRDTLFVQEEKPKQRFRCIDAYRGLTMLGMILVDNSGPHPLWPLDESKWDGISTADLIFPAFLFIMGFAVPLAIRAPLRPWKLFSRILGLFVIGFFLNLTAHTFHFEKVRIMGVLQRLSICYLLLVLIHIATNYGDRKLQKFGLMVVLFLNVAYLTLMLSFDKDCQRADNLGSRCNFTRWLDIQLFTTNHILNPTDPEGIFSTLSALLTAYGGYHFSTTMKAHKGDKKLIYKDWIVTGLVCGACSGAFSLIMPYNKKLWSTSFAFATIGISGIFLALMMLLVDDLRDQHSEDCLGWVIDVLSRPLIWLGMNPLAIFVLMDLLGIILIRCIVIDGKSAWSWFYHYGFHSWLKEDHLSSTVFSLFFALLWTLVAWLMFRAKVFIKL